MICVYYVRVRRSSKYLSLSLRNSFSADGICSTECHTDRHEAVLSGKLLPTFNKTTASIFMAEDKDEVFVQNHCSYPQI
jgi:hypothetical protein